MRIALFPVYAISVLWVHSVWAEPAQPLADSTRPPSAASSHAHATHDAAGPLPHVGLALQLGANGLATIGGGLLTVYLNPTWAVDAGAGFGMGNVKLGLAGRYYYLNLQPVHLYLGAGFAHERGWGEHTLSMSFTGTENGNTTHYDFEMKVKPAWFALGLAGAELRLGHFLVTGSVGWSQLLGGRNWSDVSGDPVDSKGKRLIDFLEGSGPSASGGIGFTL